MALLAFTSLSWDELVLLAGWEFARPGASQSLAFIYTATIGSHVETASYMDRQTGWGLQGTPTRAGLALPLSASAGDRRSSFEVFLQNQIRIDIQRHLESGALQLD